MAVDAKLGEAYVEIVARNDQFGKSLEAARSQVSQASTAMQRQFDRIKTRVAEVSKSFFSLRTAAYAAAGSLGLFYFTRRAIEVAASLDDVSNRLGVNVELLQEYRYAAEQTGVAQQTLDMALQRFIRRAAEASRGTGEAKDALQEMGVQLLDNEGNMRPVEALLGDVADAMASIEDPAHRVRLAMKLFDSEGVALVQMLREGSGEISRLRQEARDLGVVLSADLVAEAAEAGDELDKMFRVMSVTGTRAALSLTPVMRALANAFTNEELITNVTNFSRQLGGLVEFMANNSRVVLSMLAGFGAFAAVPAPPWIRLLLGAGASLTTFANLGDDAEFLNRELDTLDQRMAEVIAQLNERPDNPTLQRIYGNLQAQREALMERLMAIREAAAEVVRTQQSAIDQILNNTVDPMAASADEAADVVADLQFEIDQLGRTEFGQRLAEQLRAAGYEMDTLDEAGRALAATLSQLIHTQMEHEAAVAAAEEAQDAWLEKHREIAAVAAKGKPPIEDLDDSMKRVGDTAKDMAEEAVNSLIDLAGSAGAANEVLSNLAGNIGRMLLSSVASPIIARIGDAASNLVSGMLFHKGGIVGRPSSSRFVHPGVFAGAPRYHNGGIAGLRPNEVPAILEKGERVIPAGGEVGRGGVNITNNIHVTGGGGTRDQNKDLAEQIAAEFDRTIDSRVTESLMNQMRPGGLLNR